MALRLVAAQRVVLFGLTLLLAAAMLFAALRIIPGDVSDVILADATGVTDVKAERELIRARMGLDQPPAAQFALWLGNAVRGNLGVSFLDRKEVTQIVSERLPWSLSLAVLVTLLSAAIVVPAGILAAVFYRRWVDDAIRVISVLGLSAPNFWIGLMLIFALSVYMRWSPSTPPAQFFGDAPGNLKSLVLPVLVQTLVTAAPAIRLMRSQMLEVLRNDYIRTARAKGLAERTILLVHALPVAGAPVLAYAGFWFARMLGGLVIVEQLFLIPGVGSKLIQAILTRDYPVVQGIAIVVVAMVCVVNLLVDLLVMLLDPRTRRRS